MDYLFLFVGWGLVVFWGVKEIKKSKSKDKAFQSFFTNEGYRRFYLVNLFIWLSYWVFLGAMGVNYQIGDGSWVSIIDGTFMDSGFGFLLYTSPIWIALTAKLGKWIKEGFGSSKSKP